MKTNLVPTWMRISTQLMLMLPMIGLISNIFKSHYFKQYLADVLISVVTSVGTAIIDTVIQGIFYGSA